MIRGLIKLVRGEKGPNGPLDTSKHDSEVITLKPIFRSSQSWEQPLSLLFTHSSMKQLSSSVPSPQSSLRLQSNVSLMHRPFPHAYAVSLQIFSAWRIKRGKIVKCIYWFVNLWWMSNKCTHTFWPKFHWLHQDGGKQSWSCAGAVVIVLYVQYIWDTIYTSQVIIGIQQRIYSSVADSSSGGSGVQSSSKHVFSPRVYGNHGAKFSTY